MPEQSLQYKTIPSLSDILSFGGKIVTNGWSLPKIEKSKDLKVHIMGTTTTDMLARAIAVACNQENIRPQISQSLYGSFIQDILNPDSDFYKIKPDIVIIISDWESLVSNIPLSTSTEEVSKCIDKKVEFILSIWKRISQETGAKIIHHFPPGPCFRLTGVAEKFLPSSYSNQLRETVKKLWESNSYDVQIIDLEQFALEMGIYNSFSPRIWYSAKLPIENSSLPVYVPLLRSALRGALNTVKKALVLDLDNTLWGGVIGDDGIDGIKIGRGDAVSEAYTAFQEYIKLLSDRGIILAVCSKNDKEIAKTGFDNIGSILKVEDFAAFECSWNDKASGLRKIAKQLNIGLDSLVFVDDNPVECDLIRQELPEVSTIHLNEDPSNFISLIESGYWFQFQKYSNDDFIRSETYKNRAAALVEQDSATDLPSYLRGLEMTGVIERPTESQIERVVQLGKKTNQFNLLTQRYDEKTIRSFLDNNKNIVLACSLEDKFGKHGLVSVFIGENINETLEIKEWTMSCRVFSRSFEQFIMNFVVNKSRSLGVKKIIGNYRKTEKNEVVADIYDRLKFKKTGDKHWELNIEKNIEILETFISIK